MGRVSAGNTDGGMDEREEESAEQGGGGADRVWPARMLWLSLQAKWKDIGGFKVRL